MPTIPTSPHVRVRALLALTAAVAAGTLSACSSGSSGATTPSGSDVQRSLPSVAPTHAQRPIPPDSAIKEEPDLRKTIALTKCSADAGGWAGSGTAKNPTGSAKTYSILIFFTDKYSRTIDYARTKVTVDAGATADWSASTRFTAPVGTQCVLRGLSQT